MPHAESSPSREPATTNGEVPSSKFLSHLSSYPIVSDSISAYKSNPYGAQSLNYLSAAQQKFLDPIYPYARTPISYVSPYLNAADSYATSGLISFEKRVPLVKEDTRTVKDTVTSYIFAPVTVPKEYADKGRGYVMGVYDREAKNVGKDEGLIGIGKTILGTGLVVLSDGVGVVHGWVVRKERETTVKVKGVKDRMNVE